MSPSEITMCPVEDIDKPAPAARRVEEASASSLVVDDLVVDDLLVEDISIDGMCGVY
jgi:mycofactocin precursor